MAYIGNSPDAIQTTIEITRFNGDAACTQFQIPQDVDDAKAIEVLVNNVQQDPDNSYSVTNGLITFSEAPSVGTNNVTVLRRTGLTFTRTQIDSGDILPNAVTTIAIADGSITAAKIANGTIVTAEIADGAVTGPKLGANSVSSNNIISGLALTGNVSVTGNVTVGAGTVANPAISVVGDTNTGIFFPAADTIAFTEGGAESMRIDSSGNVGIGTSSPSQKLDVVGDARVSNTTGNKKLYIGQATPSANDGGSLEFQNSSTNINWAVRTNFNVAGALEFCPSSVAGGVSYTTPAMLITSAGNVGIGTSSPSTKLNIADSGSGVALQFNGYTSGQNIQAKIECERPNFNNFESQLRFYTHNGSSLAESMRIDSNGRIQVSGTTIVDVARISITFDAANSTGLGIKHTSATGTLLNFHNSSNSSVGNIGSNGTTTTYNTSSDYRLKENVAPMTGALAKVQQLKPCTYTWKLNGSAGQGFIAHELQEFAPYAVSGVKDGEQMQGVDYGKITPLLTAALQEAIAKIESLEARLAVLESK